MSDPIDELIARTCERSNVPTVPTDPTALAAVARLIEQPSERRPAKSQPTPTLTRRKAA